MQGADMEAALRMPVLAALGQLRIDPAVAEKVLRAALEVDATDYHLPCTHQLPVQRGCYQNAWICVASAAQGQHRKPGVQALPMLSEAELPPAVGLVLKLASESPLARAPAVGTPASSCSRVCRRLVPDTAVQNTAAAVA
jgi:hypothetical protein